MMMRRLLVRVCGLYPLDFRARFHVDMLTTIDLALESIPDGKARAPWVVRESAGLAAGAMREWIAKLATDPVVRARALPDCRYMRPVGMTRAEWAAGLTHVMPRKDAV
jgi:hypothetical protein